MLAPEDVRVLLSRLCIDLGFCLRPADVDTLSENCPESVEAFVDAVFRLEGLNPEHAGRALYRDVQAMVRQAFDSVEDP